MKAVIFDLDGTLLDTTEGILESVQYAAAKLGYPRLPLETMLKFVGPPIQDSFVIHYGCNEEKAQKAADVFRSYYKEKALLKAKLYPGTMELLVKLKEKGLKAAVATYKREDYAITLLKHSGIDIFCETIHGADNLNILKKADIVKLCLEELGEPKDEVVLVGDTGHDAVGALKTGIAFVGVTYGFGFKCHEDVNAYNNIGCADSIIDILKYI